MVSGYWFNDDQITKHIADEFKQSGYVLDPHGAIASLGFETYHKENPNSVGIFVETAHPAKFLDVVRPIIGKEIPLPEGLIDCLNKAKKSIKIKAEYNFLEEFLKTKYSL
jgi:threonine synthase